ncbi:MAG: GNAT family N-acetyltransferase [Flavobacteriaceae bacterium]|nr:GNAT family N-acetyltransferase [Flavobacteriaceae bacterium]MBL6870914.1 GNAT family N-acetyltransferase [Flavobacteriaceae bacterium]
MAEIQFRKYTAEDASTFKTLNVEWLEMYFEVEPIDERVLSNPQTEILDPGGFIVMAELEGKTVGTFAYIKKGERLYEFSKMAIDPNYRDKGHGNTMMQFAIAFAEKRNWNKIILYSSTILENSIHLYRKYGFAEVPMEPDVLYSRGNIKMEMNF